ncbi:uncharacterized protein LOC130721307 isoform X2 [Lotus japonicus]|nr:uncharacterized protein LOC130721307 isoform X2 [Lotus japonicus]XP_057428110.1 uncharacterized protein LOC130721307 isoform X2 [Lotus japonicus]XP_057428118.1 uncharacterized protein LOC130721307 isoform X2 [Lotus japonicus]XP_057428127.1 uncharacterized protein LOC130721307 isoform X2 [Lotus japonicus]XP_057428133.1 uncharacterized protein LOC130721307 isoform X2 [Lotus japonicus]
MRASLREGTRNIAAKGGRTSSKDRKIALQQDVERLKKKLRDEENIHRALERAFNRPLGSLPRLPPYLPPHTLGLVAEVAVLEEEIVRLEEQVLQFKQNLYHEPVYISASKMKLQHSASAKIANSKDSPKLSKLKSISQILGGAATSTTRPSRSTTLPEAKEQKENQPYTISTKRSKQSMYKGQTTEVPIKKLPMDNKPLKKHWNLPKKQQELRRIETPTGDKSPNVISENIMECLSSILLRMSTAKCQ